MKSKNNFIPQGLSISRKSKNRNEYIVAEERPLMVFSFKDFQYNQQIPPGYSYSQWQESKLLAYMLDKFGFICNMNRIEAVQEGYIKVYDHFPVNSKFTNPFIYDNDLQWAVVMNIKGQKPRVVGYIKDNIFFVVFLDGDHIFYPTTKKNT